MAHIAGVHMIKTTKYCFCSFSDVLRLSGAFTDSCYTRKNHWVAAQAPGKSKPKDPQYNVSILTEPAPVQVHRHKHRRNREEVHHRVHLQPEPQLVVGSDELMEIKG